MAPLTCRFWHLQYGAKRRRLQQEPSIPSGLGFGDLACCERPVWGFALRCRRTWASGRCVEVTIYAAIASGQFVPRLSHPNTVRRKCGLGSGEDDACEWPVWRHLLRRSVSRAATANECCVGNMAKRQRRESPQLRHRTRAQRTACVDSPCIARHF